MYFTIRVLAIVGELMHEACQEWILKPFEVEIDRVRSGFEDGIKI